MGDPACDLLDAELAIDRVEAELAADLPPHIRAFAAAHARGDAAPAAPALLRSERAITAARHALQHEILADRGLALLRLVAPVVIESDPEVARLRAAAPTWPGLARLAAARDAIARARFGRGALALTHALAGATSLHVVATPASSAHEDAARSTDGGGAHVDAAGRSTDGVGAHVDASARAASGIAELPAWFARDRDVSDAQIDAAWRRVATRFGVAGQVRIERAAATHANAARADSPRPAGARTFVVVPGREAIVVVPPMLDTPAARFAALHEFGHAVAALASPVALPRALDEAVASFVARLAETDEVGAPWTSALAAEARARRLAIARVLAEVEAVLEDVVRTASSQTSGSHGDPALAQLVAARSLPAQPPAALWHDAGAQAAYVEAEWLADTLATTIAEPLALVETLANQLQRIDTAFPRG